MSDVGEAHGIAAGQIHLHGRRAETELEPFNL
jgi:hypothetical protein